MRMSPFSSSGRRSAMDLSTTAAGTISHTARGVSSFLTKSASEEAPTAFSWVSSCTAFGDLSKTTHWWPPATSRRAMLAPMRPSPIIPSCIAHSFAESRGPASPQFRPCPWSSSSSSGGLGSLEDVHELAVSTRDLGDGVFACGLLVPPCDERLPEVRPPDGEADEAGDGGCRHQPLAHLLVVFAASQDDAAHLGPAAPARSGHDLLAVLAPVEPFDLPDVGLDLRLLQLLDRLDHQPGTELHVVRLRVPVEPVELCLFSGDEQLEHEPAPALVVQVLGESLQPRGLSPVQSRIALRVVAHQHLA